MCVPRTRLNLRVHRLRVFFHSQVSLNGLPTSGRVPGTQLRQTVVISGQHFGNWTTVDQHCRDLSLMDASRCASSTVCELIVESPIVRFCRGRCRSPTCQWSSGDRTDPTFAATTTGLESSRPLGTVSLRKDGAVNYLRVLSWTHNTIVAQVPEGVGVGYSLVVEVRFACGAFFY